MSRPAKHEEFSRLFQLSLDMLCIAGFDGYFKVLNPAWERTLGYTIDELLSKPYVEFIHPEDRHSTTAEAERLSGGGRVIRFHNRYVTKDGFCRWLSWMATPVPEQKLIYAVARDITEAKQAQEELRAAKAVAEDATRAKSEFLANMSHEIRTPMNAIIGMTELAIGSSTNARQREYLQSVKNAGLSLLRVIDDVLDFSKIEARKLTLDHVEFRLDELLQDVVKPLVFHARRRKLKLTSSVKRGTPTRLIGDPGRLRQVLVNLIGNAIKFTPKGSVALSVATESQTTDEVTLLFSVRDTGIGIAKHQQLLIFDAFSQADSSTTRSYGGTGLGLSISLQLIALMRGRLELKSAPGAGSTFQFTAKFERAPKPAPASKPVSKALGISLRILLAEDNPVNQKLTTELLKRRGHKVTSVRDGRAAVDLVSRRNFDVVLMDIQMPELGGVEATAAIRAKERDTGRHVPIVAMTAHAMASDRDRALKAGMDDYITKPVRVEELYSRIQRAALLSGFAGNWKLAGEVIDMFVSDVPKVMSRLQRALAARKLDAAQRAAHALKGSIGNFTTGITFETARRLEHAARENRLGESKSLFQELKMELIKLVLTLREIRKNVS